MCLQIVERLQQEGAALQKATQEEQNRKEAQLTAEHNATLAEVRQSKERYSSRYREVVATLSIAVQRAELSEKQVEDLRREASSRCTTVAWLEAQVQGAAEVLFAGP